MPTICALGALFGPSTQASQELYSKQAVLPPLPVYNGPYCEGDDYSLKNTMIPSDSLDLRFLCSANGKDMVHKILAKQKFDRDSVLDDYKKRISPIFSIPDSIRERVGFWFDIYTKYPSYMRIIHHAKYPWIKFREFDLTDYLIAPQVEWMKVQKAEKHIRQELEKIKATLLKLAKTPEPKKPTELETFLIESLAEVPGKRSTVYTEAAKAIRIQTGQMDFFVEAVMRKSQYLHEMERIFLELNVPTELTRLPLVESSFNPKAHSKAGALGIWQFMPLTGKSLMIVNDIIDERRSPLKSTVGAAKYLRANARALHGSWALSVLAYNHGPGGVSKALRIKKTREITDLINGYSGGAFGFASANYYPEFLAALYAEKYQKEVFGKLTTLPKIESEVIRLQKSMKPQDLARTLKLPVQVIAGYNLDMAAAVHSNAPLPLGYQLHVPKGFGTVLVASFNTETEAPNRSVRARGSKAEKKSATSKSRVSAAGEAAPRI